MGGVGRGVYHPGFEDAGAASGGHRLHVVRAQPHGPEPAAHHEPERPPRPHEHDQLHRRKPLRSARRLGPGRRPERHAGRGHSRQPRESHRSAPPFKPRPGPRCHWRCMPRRWLLCCRWGGRPGAGARRCLYFEGDRGARHRRGFVALVAREPLLLAGREVPARAPGASRPWPRGRPPPRGGAGLGDQGVPGGRCRGRRRPRPRRRGPLRFGLQGLAVLFEGSGGRDEGSGPGPRRPRGPLGAASGSQTCRAMRPSRRPSAVHTSTVGEPTQQRDGA
mmetsp:Transcript_103312/g.297497  ORF Transcript_103312/g.297497 Transcript_103312/m.297497 type:complete len:277 (+) Transcript_103312:1865-2695(+)